MKKILFRVKFLKTSATLSDQSARESGNILLAQLLTDCPPVHTFQDQYTARGVWFGLWYSVSSESLRGFLTISQLQESETLASLESTTQAC